MRRLIGVSICLLLIASAAYAFKTLPTGKPDLTYSAFAVTSPPVVHCGQRLITFNVTETNLGSAPTGSYLVYYFAHGAPLCAKQRPNLPPGASASFTDTCNINNGSCADCGPGTFTIPFFGFLDPLNQIVELNEANNQSQTVVQPAQCP